MILNAPDIAENTYEVVKLRTLDTESENTYKFVRLRAPDTEPENTYEVVKLMVEAKV